MYEISQDLAGKQDVQEILKTHSAHAQYPYGG